MTIGVAVWFWPLGSNDAEIQRLSSVLPADEIARAGRLRLPAMQHRFIVAHAGMRSILGAAIGAAPRDVRFVLGPHGKPALADSGDVQFNLSHSHDLAVLAVCRGAEVGVDVERVRHLDDGEHVAKRFFAPSESFAVARASGPVQDLLFMRIWTCKEAYLKVTGDGMSRPLDEVVVALGAGGEAQGLGSVSGEPLGVSLCTFDPAPGYVGALVVRAERASMRMQRWTG
jgi:4'-phosphopantetheinyl transferase